MEAQNVPTTVDFATDADGNLVAVAGDAAAFRAALDAALLAELTAMAEAA